MRINNHLLEIQRGWYKSIKRRRECICCHCSL